jgi:hypothetical protein
LRKKSGISSSRLCAFFKDYDVEPNLRVITPPPLVPSELRYQHITKFNKKWLGRYLEVKARQFFHAEPYVVIYYHPFDVYLEIRDAYLTIYECVDEWSEHPCAKQIKERIEEAEELLVRKADVVTVTADSLQQSKSKWRDDVLCVPNGVDVSVFSDRNTVAVPEDIADLPHPIIIYIGAMYEYFNRLLTENICSKRQNWNLVLIGPESVLANRVLPGNLHYLGTKNWRDLPAYLNAADVSIIPFIENRLTMNVNPLKLYEYFASGLSCVSSFMYEIKKFEEPYVLEIARSETAFMDAIERNIGKKDLQMAKKLSIAKAHSWNAIFAAFERIVLDYAENSLPHSIDGGG